MSALRGAIVLALALALPAHVLAADFIAGLKAYQREDYATALKELWPLAEQGDAGAQFMLGGMYLHGRGVPQDYASAVKWYHRAAVQGQAEAQYILGTMYADGEGVPQDYASAVKWYHRAAVQGQAEAQYILGTMYADGEGVPQDFVLAHMWFNLSAAHHLPGEWRDNAASNRDLIAKHMTPDQLAEAQRLAREWKPK
jgi:hypothetical protein